jgi:hypothetical protein
MMEKQWPKATPYQSGSPAMHRQQQASTRLLAKPFGTKGRVDQSAQRWIHQTLSSNGTPVDPQRLIHPTTALEYHQ